jgi:hypothetical protein
MRHAGSYPFSNSSPHPGTNPGLRVIHNTANTMKEINTSHSANLTKKKENKTLGHAHFQQKQKNLPPKKKDYFKKKQKIHTESPPPPKYSVETQ